MCMHLCGESNPSKAGLAWEHLFVKGSALLSLVYLMEGGRVCVWVCVLLWEPAK